MTATGALIARHVTDLFPTQTSRFDLAQAARRGVIAPLRCVRIPPGPGRAHDRQGAAAPRRGRRRVRPGDAGRAAGPAAVQPGDRRPLQDALQRRARRRLRRRRAPRLQRRRGVPRAWASRPRRVSGETPKRELAEILARYERGDIDVLVNAQLLAEGWNSPRATVCMHLAPTASKRIYQQRVGRVTRRHPGKEAGVVVDFVHPATKHDDPVVTLHSLLDRDVYRGGAIVVGPVRRGRGRRVRVERRVIPVTRRRGPPARGLRARAVADRRRAPRLRRAAHVGRARRRARRRRAAGAARGRCCTSTAAASSSARFLLTAVERNKNAQLRLRALQEIAASRDAEAFDLAIDVIGGWSRDERREAAKVMLQALAEKRIGRRDQANAWIWRLAEYTREVHEEYAVQRWPETKRLLGLLVNSSGGAHARNARRLVHASRKQDRRLQRRAARRGRGAHAGGRGGPARRAHADGPQARARSRASCCATSPRAAAAATGAGARRAIRRRWASRRWRPPRRRPTRSRHPRGPMLPTRSPPRSPRQPRRSTPPPRSPPPPTRCRSPSAAARAAARPRPRPSTRRRRRRSRRRALDR